MPSLRDSRSVGDVVPRVAVAIATLPVAIECRRVATRMSMNRNDVVAKATEFDSLGWSERQRAEPQEIGP